MSDFLFICGCREKFSAIFLKNFRETPRQTACKFPYYSEGGKKLLQNTPTKRLTNVHI